MAFVRCPSVRPSGGAEGGRTCARTSHMPVCHPLAHHRLSHARSHSKSGALQRWISQMHRPTGQPNRTEPKLARSARLPQSPMTLKDHSFADLGIRAICWAGREIILVCDLVKFVPAVAYHSCLNLPATFSQSRKIIISQPSTLSFSPLRAAASPGQPIAACR